MGKLLFTNPQHEIWWEAVYIAFDGLNQDFSAYSVRILGGVRVVCPIAGHERFRIVTRSGIGMDISWGKVECDLGPFHFKDDDESVAFAMEFGLGAEFLVHRRIALGMTIGFPVLSFHTEELMSEDYTSLDFDFLWHFSAFVFP